MGNKLTVVDVLIIWKSEGLYAVCNQEYDITNLQGVYANIYKITNLEINV